MRLTKKSHKRSKKVLARTPERVYHIKEVKFIESYPGGPKERIEILHAVDDYTFSGNYKQPNYG
jgi:hypothetical protein